MSFPRALILRAAGINCEQETKVACEKGGFWADIHHVNRVVERSELLQNYHLLVLPGGFSYGDDLGAGRVFGTELRAKLIGGIREFVGAGKLVLGICNGFQILVRAGLLPDPFAETPPTVSLANNDNGRFEDRWVYLKIRSAKSEFLKGDEVIELPVAHGEGKFVCRDSKVLEGLRKNGQIVLTYVDPAGREAGYPWNPNGSTEGIAGICDPTGRVMGLMPHPERFQDAVNHPQWARRGRDLRPDGLLFFRNACEYVRGNLL
jgi:phosphoribosylformylglycinamidine synthase subunit PurQ / glutaminase